VKNPQIQTVTWIAESRRPRREIDIQSRMSENAIAVQCRPSTVQQTP
jgi:hypothetical protein